MNLDSIQEKAARQESLTADEALGILTMPDEQLPELLEITRALREEGFGRHVESCAIINAKSGRCSENCSFCAQSAHHKTGVDCYELLSEEQILAVREQFPAEMEGHFSIVTSGKGLSDGEIDRLCEVILKHPSERLKWCTSLGILTKAQLQRLKEAGIVRYHHNLEVCRAFFPRICTTHTYDDRVSTIRAAQQIGLQVCSGGIFGLGESLTQRVELAMELRDLQVESIPVNFLVPVDGTPVANEASRDLVEATILKTIGMVRLVCPSQEVRFGGGREYHLGARQERIFDAGITGLLIGNYLTVNGRSLKDDRALMDAYEAM